MAMKEKKKKKKKKKNEAEPPDIQGHRADPAGSVTGVHLASAACSIDAPAAADIRVQ